jgi:hypothetical protein
MNYIECINVDYKSTRKESFYGTFLCVVNSYICLCLVTGH